MNTEISFDSFDLIFCVALIGGFWTGNWVPTILLVALVVMGVKKHD